MVDNPFPTFTPPVVEPPKVEPPVFTTPAAEAEKEEVKEEAKTIKQIVDSKAEIYAEMKAIEEEFGGVSNVPVNHRYYQLRNKL